MGLVYLAEHKLLGKRFAIKVLHPVLAAIRELAERFVREAKALSQLQSPHTLTVYDFDSTPDGQLYMVSEFIDGIN